MTAQAAFDRLRAGLPVQARIAERTIAIKPREWMGIYHFFDIIPEGKQHGTTAYLPPRDLYDWLSRLDSISEDRD